MRTFATTVALVAFAAFCTSCATLFTGTNDNIHFSSEPQGASVVIDGIVVGQTPATITVRRPGLNDQQVTLRMDGYDPMTFTLSKSFNTVAILNLASPIHWAIDVVTGAVMRYDRSSYSVDLERGTVAFDLDQLDRGADGSYVLPEAEGALTLVDADSGVAIIFSE
jgi:hypothetical protein